MTPELKVGTSKVNITAPVGEPLGGYSAREHPSRGVHDDLYCRCVFFDDGKTQFALASCDVTAVDADFTRKVRDLAEEQGLIPGGNLMLHAVQSHSAPHLISLRAMPRASEAWEEVLARKVVGAVRMAKDARAKARIGYGRGRLEGFHRNRRKDGGPVDYDVDVIRADSLRGERIAAMVGFGCHPVVMGPDNLLISADYPGPAMETVETACGEDFVSTFVYGGGGDINPVRRGSFAEMEAFGRALGFEAAKALEATTEFSGATVRVESRAMQLRYAKLRSIDEIRENVSVHEQKLAGLKRQKAKRVRLREQQAHLDYWTYLRDGVESKSLPKTAETEVQVAVIGNMAIVGVPGELFALSALRLKKKSKTAFTMIASLSNGCLGYFPTRDQCGAGGYEDTSSVVWFENTPAPLARGATERLEAAALEMIGKLS